MTEINPTFDAGVLLSTPLIPLFIAMKRRINRQEPEYVSTPFWAYVVGPLPMLRAYRELFPDSSLSNMYFALWLMADAIMAAGLFQFVIGSFHNARTVQQ